MLQVLATFAKDGITEAFVWEITRRHTNLSHCVLNVLIIVCQTALFPKQSTNALDAPPGQTGVALRGREGY